MHWYVTKLNIINIYMCVKCICMNFMFYRFWHAESATARAAAIIALVLRTVVMFQPMASKKIAWNCGIHMLSWYNILYVYIYIFIYLFIFIFIYNKEILQCHITMSCEFLVCAERVRGHPTIQRALCRCPWPLRTRPLFHPLLQPAMICNDASQGRDCNIEAMPIHSSNPLHQTPWFHDYLELPRLSSHMSLQSFAKI